MLKKLLLTLALGTAAFAMHDASINLNNEDIELKGSIDIGELNHSDFPDTYFLTLGMLDVDNDNDADQLFHAGFQLRQDVRGVAGLKFAIGIKGTYAKVGNLNHASVPVGVELGYTLPFDVAIPIVLTGTVDYAPSVLSYRDADRYMEKRVELGFRIIEQGTLFVGYRKIDLDFDESAGNRDYTYTDTGYIGFKVRF
ncbi:MAG: hypothetical protein IBX43_07245 [Campylobacterales bacterium]|nr:hypothetical protein [Campylobacterales bacterium]